ncbi:hypothetical protein HN873_006098, partial [Arachis hypogaea]
WKQEFQFMDVVRVECSKKFIDMIMQARCTSVPRLTQGPGKGRNQGCNVRSAFNAGSGKGPQPRFLMIQTLKYNMDFFAGIAEIQYDWDCHSFKFHGQPLLVH